MKDHNYQPSEERRGEQSRATCERCGQIRRVTYVEGRRGGVGLEVTFSRDGVTWGAPVRSCRVRKVTT